MVHSVNDFIRSELPAWKSDMAVREIGKRRKCDRNWEPFYTNSMTLTSKSLTKPEPQTQIYKNLILLVWVWFELFFIESYCPMWCPSSIGDGVSRLQSEFIYFLPILQPTLISYNTVKHIIRICTFVAKQPNKKTIHMKQHTVDPRWLWEATQTSKQHEIHQTTPIGACSQGKEKKQNNLEMACWNHPNLIPHTVLFISILQFDLRGDIQIDIPKSTNKWFTIGPCSEIRDLIRWNDSRLFDSNKTTGPSLAFRSSSFFPLADSPKKGSLARVANPAQHGNAASSTREASYYASKFAASTHQLINALLLQLLVTPLSIHLSGHQVLMQQCSNVSTALDSAFTTDMRDTFLHLAAPQLGLKKNLRDDLAPCQCLSKRLSQTFIAVILVWCDKHVPGIRNISKTGQFHPCVGSRTNWSRVNCWCCTLQYFIWPGQEWNKMDQSRFHCSWLALLALSEGCFPSCFPHVYHGLAFSVSPTCAGLCSCQQAAFEVHLRSGWYGACFKPKALQVPGSPLRPYGSASGSSGPCGSTCWCKTGRDCISQGHSWKLAYPSGPLHLLLRGLLQCRFSDGGVCCTNCLTTLNEMSIFQDFTRSNDWVTL